MTDQFAAMRIDLTEPKRLLDRAWSAMEYAEADDSPRALAYATMGMLAYTIAAAEAGMRAVDVLRREQDDRR